MNLSGTVAGTRIGTHDADLVSRPWHIQLRLRRLDFGGAAVGDPVVLEFDGAPAVRAAVRLVGQQGGHHYLAAEPTCTAELRGAVVRMVGPIAGDGRAPSDIAAELFPAPPSVHVAPALDAPLPRFTSRARPVHWAWRSLLRAIAHHSGMPVDWRYDARADRLVIESGRADWRPVTIDEPIRHNAHWITYDPSPVLAGDVVAGRAVLYARTYLSTRHRYTRTRTEEI